MKWEAEGGKGLLWVGIRKGLCKRSLLVCKKGIFCGQRRKVRTKEVFVRKKAALSEVCKAFCKRKTFGLRKRAVFSAHAKPTNKEKLFSAHNDTDFALHQS